MTRSIVISGPPAVGKTTVAKALAAEFGMRHVSGGDVLKEMASEAGFDSGGDDWWDTQEGMRFLAEREKNPDFDRELDKRLSGMFEAGGAVITSYTLPWLVSGGVKVWLDGSHESSAARMRARDNMSQQDALEVTRRRFDKNKVLYKRLYGYDFGGDGAVFDVIIDTDGLSAEQVIAAARAKVGGLL